MSASAYKNVRSYLHCPRCKHNPWANAEKSEGDKCPWCMKAHLEWHDKAPTQQQHN